MGTVDLCLRSAKVSSRETLLEVNIVIDGGKIVSISKSPPPKADKTIDLGGRVLLPGVVDAHVHFRDPGLTHKEDFSTGSKAAAAGGVTLVCDMPNNSPPIDSLDKFREKRKIVESKSYVDFGLHGMLTNSPEEGKRLLNAGAVSLKLYPELYDDSKISNFQDKRTIITVHPEDPDMLARTKAKEDDVNAFIRARPKGAEVSEIARILDLTSDPHIHFCHVTTRDSVELISKEKEKRKISCEVTPHHLLLDRSHLQEFGSIVKTYPPVRTKGDRLVLLHALEKSLIDIVATDHAPHTLEEKNEGLMEAPPGIAGVETSLPLLFTMVQKKKLSLSRLVEAMCSSPARIFNLRNDEGILKGTLKPGADADLVAINQNQKWKIKGENLHGKTKFTPFENQEVIGKPFLTLVRGEIVYRDDEIIGGRGHGNFIPARA